MDLNFKERLFIRCKEILSDRVLHAKKAMNDAQDAANNEEKSSAGDKFETGRAMGHRDRDMYAKQVVENEKELHRIEKLSLKTSKIIKPGSLIRTDSNTYFIVTGLGKVVIEEQEIMVISAQSPIAQLLMDKKIMDKISFNGLSSSIVEIL